MKPEERAQLLKDISFSIGLSHFPWPEQKAKVALEEIEKHYTLTKKEEENTI
jgi:hypothetical protein